MPRSLKVSEANTFKPRADIVWRGEALGDRYQQVEAIFADAMTAASRGEHAQALQIWQPLAEQGDARAQYELAGMYADGVELAQDYAAALRWYRAAAEQRRIPIPEVSDFDSPIGQGATGLVDGQFVLLGGAAFLAEHGVDTAALDSRSMAAKTVPGLYFIGEAVDVTGWLGGYNFQWAWASGHAAGQEA